MRCLSLVLLLCLLAQTADAGAWPRKAKSGFASVATRLTWPQDIGRWSDRGPTETYQTAYFEYGITDRLTVGFDLGRAVSGKGKSIGFIQYPLRNRDAGPKVSAQLGFGRISGRPVMRPGVSVGWGLDRGWVSVDTVAEIQIDSAQTDYKIDVTWGRVLSRDMKLVMQVQTGAPHDETVFARLAPSLVVPISKRFRVVVGGTYGLTGDDTMGLKLGLWSEF